MIKSLVSQPADFGVNTWQALVEVRYRGAISEFTLRLHKVRAETEDLARQYILYDCRMYGYEPRNIIQLQRIK